MGTTQVSGVLTCPWVTANDPGFAVRAGTQRARCPAELSSPNIDYDGPVSRRLRGREPQVDVLRGQLDALRAGRGGIVLVSGPAGAGKTTLLVEAASLAVDREIRAFCGGGDPGARAVPLGPILDALVSAEDPPVAVARLRELSQSPDQRFWLLRELQESLEKA